MERGDASEQNAGPTPTDAQDDSTRLAPQDEEEALRLRAAMVAQLTETRALADPAVIHALLAVPRHRFLPKSTLAEAYSNVAVTTSWEHGAPVSSVSQPEIVALMLEQLRVEPGMRALEIGAGSGYNAALLAELVGPAGSVVSIEIDAELAASATTRLAEAGYPQKRARIVAGDGWRGWPDGAPFDRIEITVGVTDLSPEWFTQLREDGLLVAPLWLGATDVSVALRKQGGRLVSESWALCGFVRLRGVGAEPAHFARISDQLTLTGPNAQSAAQEVGALLGSHPRRIWWSSHNANFIQYLALASGRMLSLWQTGGRRSKRPRGRYLLYMEGPDGPSMVIFPQRTPALLTFGGSTAERFTREQYEAYRQRGAPSVESWRLVAYPLPADLPPPAPGVTRLAKSHWVYDISTE